MTTQDIVRTSRDGLIATITIDNPPVNVLSHALRSALYDQLKDAGGDAEVNGIVIACAGRTFIAGADIAELGTGKQKTFPLLPDLCRLIESLDKPVVAAIHGTALGGGLEMALACHYRVAQRAAKLGLPEVKLGIIPGAGGTVRLPRLVGAETALDMIASGTPVGAGEAQAIGLADAVVDGPIAEGARDFLLGLIARKAPLPLPLPMREERLEATRRDPSALDAAAAKIEGRSRGLAAPVACIAAVRNAVKLPFDQALKAERAAFMELSTGGESRALRHLFFAERDAAKVAGIGKEVAPRAIGTVGVIGAGTMGAGIAMAMLSAGLEVTIVERDADALERGLANIRKTFAISVSRGSQSQADVDARLARLTPATTFDALAASDLILEAVFEDMAVKKDVFARLDAVARPGAILATNTSYLDVDAIAAATGRPRDVVGMHFFSPANVMRLVEVVRGRETSSDVVVTATTLARSLGKIPVVVGVCRGFVGNRMLATRTAAVERLLLEGVTPVQIDAAFAGFGWAMGPCRIADLAGLDIGWRNRKAFGGSAPVADALCDLGRFGQKTGRGFYLYEAGTREPKEDPHVAAIAVAKGADLGIAPRPATADEIIERTHGPMVEEGRRILEEGIAARSSDIDLIWVNGYGFPVAKGGPMFWAERRAQ